MNPINQQEAQRVIAENRCWLLWRVGDDFYPCADAKEANKFLSSNHPIPYAQKCLIWQRGYGYKLGVEELSEPRPRRLGYAGSRRA
jgi:hypothetical protein